MYDSLVITTLSLHPVALLSRNRAPQSLGQASKDDTIGVHKLPQSSGRESMGILVGPRCRLELFLGLRLRAAQRHSRFGHHCRLDTNISECRNSTVVS